MRDEPDIINQTTAYIYVVNGVHITKVVSEGKLVKWVKTPESQIRPERTTCLYQCRLAI